MTAVVLATAVNCALAEEDDESDSDETDETSETDDDDDHPLWSLLGRSKEPARPLLSFHDYPEHARFLLFSSTDLWRNGGYAHGGMLWSPFGFRDDGLVVKLIFGGGVYRYQSGALGNVDVIGRQFSGSLLPGWRFTRDGLTVSVFVGYDFQDHRLYPDDPSAGLRGSYSGIRTGFEFWYQPNPHTMFAADGSVSSIGRSYSVRAAAGWRVAEWFYLGPELQAFAADDNYRQYRAGAHLTGFRVGETEWSGGIGLARDSDERSSLYGKLGVLARY